jgi:hypothetical protein
MEIEWLLFPIIYLVIASGVMVILPDSVYLGDVPKSQSAASYRNLANLSATQPEGVVDELSFFYKLVTFLFVTFDINGIPAFFGVIILIINLIMMILPIVWIYDKARGIP